MNDDQPAIIFIHIPKAAGATLTRIISRQYRYSQIFIIDGVHKQSSIDRFRSLPEHKIRTIRGVSGHMPFGLHRWLPCGATYVSMLRHPVKRIISDYYYVRRTRRHRLHSDMKTRNLSIEEYVLRQIAWNGNNLQTRLISGMLNMDSVTPPYEPLPSEALDIAKRNIDHFFGVCGLTEQFDRSILLMKAIFGWDNVFYRKSNVAPQRQQSDDIPKSTIALIEESENHDLELYHFVKGRLGRMLKEHAISDDKVCAFRKANQAYSATCAIFESSNSFLRISIRKATIYMDKVFRR